MWRSLFSLGSVLRLIGAGACASDSVQSWQLPDLDAERFASDVYPVLLRDCAMAACHGSEQRFFRVAGPGRVRLSRASAPLDLATEEEIMFSYNRARSMLASDADVAHSRLLTKPLEVAAGGAAHLGQDMFGRNLYATTTAPGYKAIRNWALSIPRPRSHEVSP